MADRWTLTVRDGPRVTRMRFETLAETLDALERRIEELAPTARRRAGRSPLGQTVGRRFDPARQVAVRAELAGPGRPLGGVRGGVDLRGDGALEAYTGRLRRTLVQPRAAESPYEALRRSLEGLAS
jgi:hypothetical protein